MLLTPLTALNSNPTRDTINMMPGRTHDVFYALQTGDEYAQPRDNWDIQFSAARMDVSIRTNGAIGVKLYTYPNSDITGWATLDTTGLSTWPVQYNDDSSWEMGAFNINATESLFDFGWGIYNEFTHNIVGDSLFVMELPGGTYKKIWIIQKNPNLGINQYTFMYANLDGSDEKEVTISGDDYAGKNFVGYSFDNNAIVDRDAPSDSWDLQFTKFITFYGGEMWYPVTGILQNNNVQVAAYPGVDTSFVDYAISALDSTTISTIGNNWYSLQGGMPPTYVITDSLVYFVSDRESSIWKLVFEYYESSAGKIGFRKQLLDDHSSISEIDGVTTGNVAIHPNPASGNTIHLLFNASENNPAQLSIYNLLGAKVVEKTLNVTSGLNDYTVDVSSFPKGAYLVVLESDNIVLKNKFIKQ